MKVALVTGASRGIGRATAVRLAKDGYTVAVNYSRSDAEAASVLEEIRSLGGEGMLCKANVANPTEVHEMVSIVYKTYKQIDLLVNNAGIVQDEYLLMVTPDALDQCLSLNVKGYFYCAQEVALKMFRQKRGIIINMSSVSGELALAGQSVYSATKGAVNSMTRVLARELSAKGIRVNAVAPGFIETDMLRALPEDKKEEYLAGIPLRRFGRAEEVAAVISALASDAFGYMTGQILTLDGGISL